MKIFILTTLLLTIASLNVRADDHKHTGKTPHNHKHSDAKKTQVKSDDSDKMCLDCGKKESECSCEKHGHEETNAKKK